MTHSFPTRRSADLRGGRHGHLLSAADRERSEQHRDADQDRKERAKAHARSYGRDAAVVQRPILPLARRLKLTPLSLTASLHWREEDRMAGLWFDELEVGQRFDHAIRRTVTETDNLLFSTLTTNTPRLPLYAEYMKDPDFARNILNPTFPQGLQVGFSFGDP